MMDRNSWELCQFGIEAEKLRVERGIAKTVLCRRLGISTAYYDYIIHGQRPGLKQKERIIQILKSA